MKVEVAHVYRAENGRRYFTKRGAARASVAYRMRKAHPTMQAEFDGDYGQFINPGFHWAEDERLVRIGAYLVNRMLRTR